MFHHSQNFLRLDTDQQRNRNNWAKENSEVRNDGYTVESVQLEIIYGGVKVEEKQINKEIINKRTGKPYSEHFINFVLKGKKMDYSAFKTNEELNEFFNELRSVSTADDLPFIF